MAKKRIGSDKLIELYKREYTKELRSTSLEGFKIGVNRAHMNTMEEEEIVSSEKLLVVLKKAGAILVEDINMPYHKELKDILENEFKNNMNHYLSTLNPSFKIKTLEDIIEYNKQNLFVLTLAARGAIGPPRLRELSSTHCIL